MSRYFCLDDSEPSFLASTLGWGGFCSWVEQLETADRADLMHLVDYGWIEDLGAVERELQEALAAESPADDTAAIARSLLQALAQRNEATVLLITDGLGSSEG